MRLCAVLLGLSVMAGAASAGPLVEPQHVSGRLEAGGTFTEELPALRKGLYFLVLEGPRGQVDLDLIVRGSEGSEWASRGRGAQEEVLVPSGEALTVEVVHYAGEAADFVLHVHQVRLGSPVRPGESVEGTAGEGGGRLQVHELLGTRRAFARVQLEGSRPNVDLDLFLYDAAFVKGQESVGATGQEEFVAPPASGRRYVVIKAFRGQSDYTLGVSEVGLESKLLRGEDRIGGRVSADGERYYRLRTSRDGVLTVRLEGPADQDLDIEVFGPEGYYRKSVAPDAFEEIAINGTRSGDYLIHVYPGQEGHEGAFQLSTIPLELRRLARNGAGGRKVWGLFVGVAEYLEVNDLSYTCGDALALYQELREIGGVDTRHSIVLLDEGATRAEVGAALDAIAERADEDDTFVFFYSGHGGDSLPDGQRGDAQDEVDGDDEFLVCYDSRSANNDGNLIDDDLRTYLDRIRCEQQVLLFDACFAGGFAELIDTPGRYGLFSSLETQLSREEPDLKAGLLTAILVRALTGEADAAPYGDGNGKVTLGELTRFVNAVQPEQGDTRQIPVILNQLGDDVVITSPGRPQPR